MTREELQKMHKIELWIIMCKVGIISGDCSAYRIKAEHWTKDDMIETILHTVIGGLNND